METVKVMPWGEGQGEYVVVNADELNDSHVLYSPKPEPKPEKKGSKSRNKDKAPN